MPKPIQTRDIFETRKCLCVCCAHWRRRVHRVASDGDKRNAKLMSLAQGRLAEINRMHEYAQNERKYTHSIQRRFSISAWFQYVNLWTRIKFLFFPNRTYDKYVKRCENES